MPNSRSAIAGALRLCNESDGDQPGENDRQDRRYRPWADIPHGREVSTPGDRVNATVGARDTRSEAASEHLLQGNDAEQNGQASGDEQKVEPSRHMAKR